MLTEDCRIVIAKAKPEANQKYRMLVCFAALAMTVKYNNKGFSNIFILLTE
jgi:hypothetical protein